MPKADAKEVIKLTEEDKKQLEALKGDIAKGEKAIAAMKEMGMDVTDLEGKLEWAKKAQEVLLREFV